MANNTDWLNISQMTGGTGETALSLTALTNDSLSAKTATVVAKNTTFNVSGTSLITLQGFQPTLTLSRSTLRFDSTGGTATFTVYSNTAWTINFPSMVQSYSLSAGTGDTEVTVVVGPNPQEVGRTETGLVKDIFNVNQLYLTLVQESFIAELYVNPTEIIFDASGSTEYITIEANCDWEIEYPSWVTPSVISGGSGTTIVALTAGENNTADRTGKVIVYAGSKSVEVNLFQPLYIPTYITVTPSAWTFNYTEDGKTFIVDSFPEWTAEIISTGVSGWDVPYVECTFVIPSAMTMNLAGEIWYDSPIRHYSSAFTFTSGGTYKLRYEDTGGTAPVLSGNTYLTELFISDEVTTIPSNAFKGCSSLSSVTIGSGLTSVGSLAFSGCSSLTGITITAPTAPSVSATSFQGIATGGTLTYPQGSNYNSWLSPFSYYLGYYGWPGFVGNEYTVATYDVTTTAATKIAGNNVSGHILKMELEDGTPLSFASTSNSTANFPATGSQIVKIWTTTSTLDKNGSYGFFESVTALTSIEISAAISAIGDECFSGCTGLTSVTIPSSVISIGESAFYDCDNLASITIPNSVRSIGNSAFISCDSLASIDLGEGVASIGDSTFENCPSLTSVTIPNSVSGIGQYAFSACTGLTNITIGSGVTNIGSSALTGCTFLFSNFINNSSLDAEANDYWGAFVYSVHQADGLWIRNNVTVVKCDTNATSVTIPSTVTRIGDYAFKDCNSLTSVTIPDSVISIGDAAFSSCTGLTSVVLGSGVTSIGSSAFTICSGLTSIVIPSSVTSIGDSAFAMCSSLTSVTIPSSVTLINSQTFDRCTGLTSITLPNTITSIGYLAFNDCSSLTSITIPDSVITIGRQSFYYCTSLNSVVIGSGVTSIGDNAFWDCSALSAITSYPVTAPTIGRETFRNVMRNGTLYYPTGSNYSTWLSTGNYYLGKYGWTGQEI